VRIIRLANFVAPHSGGLRTSLAELGAGYLAAGHEPVLVIPGDRDDDERCAQGRVITLRAPRVPFTGGYRVLWRRRRLARLLAALRPDALEVSDRTTLRWTGAWAREHGVPAVMVSHESVTALLKLTLLGPGRLRSALSRGVADWLNRRTARAGRDLRAGRPGGAGLRDPGGGQRGVRTTRGGGRRRGQCSRRGSRGRRASGAGPAGTVPAGRRPRPRGAVRLGHGRARLPGRARGRG
jgi:alpha-1,6-mannosyltransferase